MNFEILNENNEFKLGSIISIFKIPESNKEIALFSVGDYETDNASLNIAYLNTDNDGYDYITEIEDEKVYKKAMMVVKDMMGVIKENE